MNHRMGPLHMVVCCVAALALALLAVTFGFGALAPILLVGCALMMVMMMRGMGAGHDDPGHDSHREQM